MRIHTLYFLGYDIDDSFPWHSTISRICQLFPEHVFETLTQFMGMHKVNTTGIKQANKVMHITAMAYNLKK